MAGSTVLNNARMVKSCRNKAADVVADATVLIGGKMATAFPGSKSGIVTGGAIVDNASVREARREKTAGYIAIAAITIGRHMGERFADGGTAVMAGTTVAFDALVIKIRIGKSRGGVADRAVITGRNVWRTDPGIFSCGIDAVMTGSAGGNDTLVIEHRRYETPSCNMTDATVFVGGNMIRYGVFAGGIDPIVAGITATAEHFGSGVIDKRLSKTGGVMTDRTITAGVLMHWNRCHRQRTDADIGRIAVVTGRAVVSDADMIKTGREKAVVVMAQTTILHGGQMISSPKQIPTSGQKLIAVTACAPRSDIRMNGVQKDR